MAVSIFKRPLNKEVELIKSDIGIVENGTTATHNISSGQYVIWQGNLCTASSAISMGDTLSSSNLTAVSNGGLNALNGKITRSENKTINLATGWSADQADVRVTFNAGYINIRGLKIATGATGWTTFGTIAGNIVPSERTYGVLTDDSKMSGGTTSVAQARINADGSIDIYAPQSGDKYWGGFAFPIG